MMMYASLHRHVIGEGAIGALMRRVEDEFSLAISQQPGFVCFFALGIDDLTIEMISIFRDQESAERSDEFATAYLRENFRELNLEGEAMTGGEVLVSRVALEALEDAQRLLAGSSCALRSSTPAVSKRPVLVVGATGRTGRLIVDRLLARGVPVHALVRDRAKGAGMLPSAARQFIGNVCSSDTLIAPMEGVGAVIVATAGGSDHANTAELVDYFGTLNLVKQAVASHADLVVFISTLGATRPAHSMDVEPTSLGWKAMAEGIVRSSGIPYCIVRAGWLADGAGGEPLSVSQGDTDDGRISRVDLADVCTELLFLSSARGKTIDVVAAREGPVLSLEAALAAATPDTALESRSVANTTIPHDQVPG